MEEDKAKTRGERLSVPFKDLLALLSVAIAGLGLFLAYANHRKDRIDAVQQAQAHTVLILRGEGGGPRLRLVPANSNQVVQSQTFYFPSAVRSSPVQITGDGHLDAGWFASGLKKALRGKDDDGAEHSLPAAIVTTYVQDGDTRSDLSLYQVGFSIHTRLLQPATVQLEGMALNRRGLNGAPQAAVDAAWSRQTPGKP